MLAYVFIIVNFVLAVFSQTVVLPVSPGSNVYITNFSVTDRSRPDPFSPGGNKPRRLMVSLFQPANCTQTQQLSYMPPKTAALHDDVFSTIGIPNGTFEAFRVKTCASPPKNTDFPVVLFSTGAGTSRYLYTVICQWVASLGFNVVSIDHTYDAPIVEFPDGRVILQANITFPDDLAKVIKLRVGDLQSVLSVLSNSTTTAKLGLPQFKTKQVGAFGHSLGGATAADTMLLEPRIVGGLNMDGSIYGQATNKTQKNPFVLFAAGQHNQTDDVTWAAFWQELKGSKLQLQVQGTEHGSFVDYPVLANAIGLNASSNPILEPFIGNVAGIRMLHILRTYVGGFFQDVLESQKVQILQGPSPKFPEVLFVNGSLGI